MKKTTVVLVSLVILLSVLMIPISAAAYGSFGVSASSVSPGSTFVVTVSINNADGVGSIGIEPTYDKSAFDFVSGQWLISGALSEADLSKKGVAILAFNGTENVNGAVYSFTLRVKDSATGTYTIGGAVKTNDTYISVSGATVSTSCDHSFTKKTVSDAYKKSDATCFEPAIYYFECEYCGTASTSQTFTYGTKLEHSYVKEVVDDEYLLFEATCMNKAAYFKSCVCGEKGQDVFTVGDFTDHQYKNRVTSDDFLCSKAGCENAAKYYYSCVCGKKGTETFEEGSALGHKFEYKWSGDTVNHWRKCSLCNEILDFGEHSAGPAATEYNAQTCEVCDYEITPALGHTHKYDFAEFYSNSSQHWNLCECGYKFNAKNHTWDSGTITKAATVYETGIIEFTCKVCDYVRVETLEKLAPETEAPTSAPTEAPTSAPTEAPTSAPTEAPTSAPTEAPTDAPTEEPTESPTEVVPEEPTEEMTEAPTESPTEAVTEAPIEAPTEEVTEKFEEETYPEYFEADPYRNIKLAIVFVIGLGAIGAFVIILIFKSKR